MGRCVMSMALMTMALVFMISMAEAQNVPSCAEQLVPCVNYLNATNPPSSCCNPLKQTVETQLSCLCNLFFTPGLLQSFNINVTEALQLSHRCGVNSDISNCKAKAPTSSGTPPATPGGHSGDADRVTFTGLSFLLLFLASMLFN